MLCVAFLYKSYKQEMGGGGGAGVCVCVGGER